MKILILGGTGFVGRAIVDDALGAGHEVTLVHRGNQPKPQEWNVKEIFADRSAEHEFLAGQTWDAVVDVSGYVPSVVRRSAEALRNSVGRYLFISTVSIFSDDEFGNSVVSAETWQGDETVNGASYGPLKLACERLVDSVFGGRCTVVRPGLVAGPYDVTLRLPYWVDRLSRFEKVLVPEDLEGRLQQIDARDLARFTVSLLERDIEGTYVVTGEAMKVREIFASVPGFDNGKLVSCPLTGLEGDELAFRMGLPLMGYAGTRFLRNPAAALALGLQRRPISETIADTHAWLQAEHAKGRAFTGMMSDESRAKELALIQRLQNG